MSSSIRFSTLSSKDIEEKINKMPKPERSKNRVPKNNFLLNAGLIVITVSAVFYLIFKLKKDYDTIESLKMKNDQYSKEIETINRRILEKKPQIDQLTLSKESLSQEYESQLKMKQETEENLEEIQKTEAELTSKKTKLDSQLQIKKQNHRDLILEKNRRLIYPMEYDRRGRFYPFGYTPLGPYHQYNDYNDFNMYKTFGPKVDYFSPYSLYKRFNQFEKFSPKWIE